MIMKLRKQHHRMVGALAFLPLTVVALRDSTERDSVTLGVSTGGKVFRLNGTDNDTDGVHVQLTNETAAKVDVKRNEIASPLEIASPSVRNDTRDTAQVEEIASEGLGEIEKRPAWKDQPNKQKVEPHSREQHWDIWWIYNPFRKFFGLPEMTLDSDLQCPNMDDWIDARKNLTFGEIIMCKIRYVTLSACDLPEGTCTICNCDIPEEIERFAEDGATQCVPRSCYLKLPYIWLQYHVVLPFIVLLVHIVVSPLIAIGYQKLLTIKPIQKQIIQHIGLTDSAPEKIVFRVYLLTIQIVASGLNVFLYCILDLYESPRMPWKNGPDHAYYPTWNNYLQFFLNLQMLVNFVITWCKNGFSIRALFSINAIIDLMTVHSTLIRQAIYTNADPPLSKGYNADVEVTWLALSRPQMNWQFLRSYRCLSALMEMQALGALSGFSLVKQAFMKTGLRLWALVNLFTGLTQIIEMLGYDMAVSSLTGENKDRNLGDCGTSEHLMEGSLACVPFLVGIYWVFVTISSCGFGDFGPSSAPTYILVIVFIVAGVTFFSVETQTLLDVVEDQSSGIIPADVKGVHVVLTGSAMRDVDTSVLKPFVLQLFHRAIIDQGGAWPELVILGKVEDHTEVINFLSDNLRGDMRKYVQFCNADPLTPQALTQAKVDSATVCYILPSTLSGDIDLEDEYNTNVALSVKSLTRTPFRLVLFRVRSIEIALASGIHPGQCCSLNDLRSSILAQSTRVRGWAHVLTLMTNNVLTHLEGAKKYCHEALIPEQYFHSLSHTIRGFALNKYTAGADFHELAIAMYRQTGALALCMLTSTGKEIKVFPWSEVATPDALIFCLHHIEFTEDPKAATFVDKIDWQKQLVNMRKKEETKRISGSGDMDPRVLDYPLEEVAATDEDMSLMESKAQDMKSSEAPFVLVVMTDNEDMWTMLNMYLQKFSLLSKSEGPEGPWGMVILTSTLPPRSLLEKVNALDPQVPVAFVEGSWTKPGVLRDAGAEQCKVLLAFPVTSALSAKPENDSRIFFFIQIIKNLNLRKETLLLLELGSGTSGAHVLPTHEDSPPPPELVGEEIAFTPPCAGGQVFMPHMIMGLLAKTFYTFGILEVFQALVNDAPPGKNCAHPEQIFVPKNLINKTFGHAVECFLLKRIGPCPALLIALLRETLDGEVVLIKPEKSTTIFETDLLFLLMDEEWTQWADKQGLRCMGGRRRRSADMEGFESPMVKQLSAGLISTGLDAYAIRPKREDDETEEADGAGKEEGEDAEEDDSF